MLPLAVKICTSTRSFVHLCNPFRRGLQPTGSVPFGIPTQVPQIVPPFGDSSRGRRLESGTSTVTAMNMEGCTEERDKFLGFIRKTTQPAATRTPLLSHLCAAKSSKDCDKDEETSNPFFGSRESVLLDQSIYGKNFKSGRAKESVHRANEFLREDS